MSILEKYQQSLTEKNYGATALENKQLTDLSKSPASQKVNQGRGAYNTCCSTMLPQFKLFLSFR